MSVKTAPSAGSVLRGATLTLATAALGTGCISFDGLSQSREQYESAARGRRDASSASADARADSASNGDARVEEDAGIAPSDGGDAGDYSCVAASADDGADAASNLAGSGLDCQLLNNPRNWSDAMRGCASLDGGYRLVTKAEAWVLVSARRACRPPLPSTWATWTSTCAGPSTAWGVSGAGATSQDSVDYFGYIYALCVRYMSPVAYELRSRATALAA
jgi:hypothetical protein